MVFGGDVEEAMGDITRASTGSDWNHGEIFEAIDLALKEAESDGKVADTRKHPSYFNVCLRLSCSPRLF